MRRLTLEPGNALTYAEAEVGDQRASLLMGVDALKQETFLR